VLAGVVVTVLSLVSLTFPRPATADSLSSARAQATEINAQLQADAQKVDALSQSYDTALQKVQQLNAALAQTRAAIGRDQQRVTVDQRNLRQDALDAYTTDGGSAGLDSMFSGGGEKAVVTSEYRAVATGNVSNAVDRVSQAESRLTAEQSQLQSTQSQATAALAQTAAARQQAEATVAAQEATLAEVKGQIATLVAQQQAAEQAAQYAAFQKRVAAANAAAAAHPTAAGSAPSLSSPPPVPVAPPPLPVLPTASGAAAAVAAAESQIGVPYRWGGENPGVGFDCSGLTQWAWGRAGVSLPRTAQEQYDAVEHISLGALQPGDLVFWGDGGISHVAIYVGGGEVIHAPETGEVVQIQPIWNSGLVGAGRP
jgi:cell wall-associated NlpC family hydrolase